MRKMKKCQIVRGILMNPICSQGRNVNNNFSRVFIVFKILS